MNEEKRKTETESVNLKMNGWIRDDWYNTGKFES